MVYNFLLPYIMKASYRLANMFKENKTLHRADLNDIFGSRTVTSLIQVLEKKWYNLYTKYNELWFPDTYTLICYNKPFYLIARDIQRRYPEFEKQIRKEFAECEEKAKNN